MTQAKSNTLPVMEAFHSIQGEGYHSGKAAYFIRLGGCDVGCHWCDVKESWNEEDHPNLSVNEICDKTNDLNSDITIITGGEPLMYNLDNLTEALRANNQRTHLETSGVYPITGNWHWICFSPKKFKKPVEEIYMKANELKVIVYNKSDLAWAETHRKKLNKNCKLYLQPEWSKHKQMMPLIVDYVKRNPDWEISLQIHKFIDVP